MMLPLLNAAILLLSNYELAAGFTSPKGAITFKTTSCVRYKVRLWSNAPFKSKVNGDSSASEIIQSVNADLDESVIISQFNDACGKTDPPLEIFHQADKEPSYKPPFPVVLWRFTRPHTLIGSAIAIPSIFLLASPTYAIFFTKQSLAALLYATVPSLLMNLYITGLNQITDVEIDKINKPELVLAKGDLKKSTAIAVVTIACVVSLIMSVIHPFFSTSGLQMSLWGSFILGTMYSLPPFRMKRHPLLAAFCIVAVRGTIINTGFYSHALTSAFDTGNVAGTGVLSCFLHDWKCSSSSIFFGIFGIAIALMKDVPDVVGDRIFNIHSFTVKIGQKRVFRIVKNLLTLMFGVVGTALVRRIASADSVVDSARRTLVGIGCLAAVWSTRREAEDVDAEDSGEVYNYYMHLWKLFYLSYFALPFVK